MQRIIKMIIDLKFGIQIEVKLPLVIKIELIIISLKSKLFYKSRENTGCNRRRKDETKVSTKLNHFYT